MKHQGVVAGKDMIHFLQVFERLSYWQKLDSLCALIRREYASEFGSSRKTRFSLMWESPNRIVWKLIGFPLFTVNPFSVCIPGDIPVWAMCPVSFRWRVIACVWREFILRLSHGDHWENFNIGRPWSWNCSSDYNSLLKARGNKYSEKLSVLSFLKSSFFKKVF